MKPLLLFFLFTSSLLLSSGCAELQLDLFTVNGIVSGRVLDQQGAPVRPATVRAIVGAPRQSSDSALTDTEGAYSIRFQGFSEPDVRAPLVLQITPPSSAVLLPRDTAGLTIVIARGWPPREPTVVDIVLGAP